MLDSTDFKTADFEFLFKDTKGSDRQLKKRILYVPVQTQEQLAYFIAT